MASPDDLGLRFIGHHPRLPLTADLTLHAAPLQMGLLSTALTLPIPLFFLFDGVFTDRLRAMLLAFIPLSTVFHLLSFPLLGFLAGACSIVFDVAYQPYLTSIIRPDQLVEGNGKLEASSAVAAVAGPDLAGRLVTLLGAGLPGWALRRYGLGRTLVVSTDVMGAAAVLFPLAGGPVWAATLLLGTGLFFQRLSSVVYRVQ